MKILLVEDDRSLGATLKERLQKEGYEVVWTTSVAEATQARASSAFDLYLLDVGLPDGDGFSLAQEIAAQPLIFLTAQSDAQSRLQGYDLGAEEYIPKPFHLRELLIRVRHVLDNHRPLKEALVLGDLEINFEAFTVTRRGVAETVAVKDLQLLKLLVEKCPRVISRDEALNSLRGEDKFPSNRTVDNSVLRLRSLLGPAGVCIESVRGIGYRWNLNAWENPL